MQKWARQPSFLQAFGIMQEDVVCLSGAGGKTSLMFKLADEAKARGWKVLVTTTTRILFPRKNQYDRISVGEQPLLPPGADSGLVHVIGTRCPQGDKLCSADDNVLALCTKHFDLTLIEADGAAEKPLKGWKRNEPVIPAFTTKTLGILDIQTVGKPVSENIIHRLELFSRITGAGTNDRVSLTHLQKIAASERGLFQHAVGQKVLYLNKMESEADRKNAQQLRSIIHNCTTRAGSIREDSIYG